VTRAHAVPVSPLSGATPCVVGCSRLLRPPAPAATNSTRGTVINKQKTHKQERSSQACDTGTTTCTCCFTTYAADNETRSGTKYCFFLFFLAYYRAVSSFNQVIKSSVGGAACTWRASEVGQCGRFCWTSAGPRTAGRRVAGPILISFFLRETV
jgi:hypothetical protein